MRGLRVAAIAAAAGLFVLPLAFMVLGSLRTPGLPPPSGFEWLPRPLRSDNYRDVFTFVPLARALLNSLVVVAVAVPVTVVVGSWAGFAIVTAPARRQRALVIVSVVALLVPVSALWVPRFAIYRWLGLTDTLWPLMAPALMATTPFYVLVFAVAYARVPRSLYEAAALDGMSTLSTWWRVALPLARPATFAVAILAFVAHWSSFVEPLLYLSSPERATAPLALRSLQTLEPTNYPIMLAGAVIVTVPTVVAFLMAQRAFFVKTLHL